MAAVSEQIKIIGSIYILGGILFDVLIAAFLAILVVFHFSDEAGGGATLFDTLYELYFYAMLVVPIVAGVGLLVHQPWARYLGLFVGVCVLLFFPIGTICGAYAIWVLLQKSASEYFGQHG